MRVGKSLIELATEIERQNSTKRDFLVPTTETEVVVQENVNPSTNLPSTDVRLVFGDQSLDIGKTAHDQIASELQIPAAYYRRMLSEQPSLLADNINVWLNAQPKTRMIRTLDGKARAFLSDSYRPLDNYELASAILPALGELNLKLISSEITESRLYIKAIDAAVMEEIPQGAKLGEGHTFVKLRALHPSVTISNSEIGKGRLRIDQGYFDQFCTNLAIFEKAGFKKNHVGAKYGEFDDEDVYKLLTSEAREAGDRALWLQVRDVVKNGFNPEAFAGRVKQITDLQGRQIESDNIPKVIEVTAKRFDLTEGEGNSILKNLIAGGDLSQFGLLNAITKTAETVSDYDRATEFERIGGKVIELAANDWAVLSKAA